MKKVLAAILSVCVMLSITVVPVSAVEQGIIGIQPLWTNTNSINLALSYSGSTATWSGVIQGQPGTTKIEATFTLAKKNTNGTYTNLKSWTASSSNFLLSATNTYSSVSSGTTYRITVTSKVTRNGTTETVTTSHERKY